MRRWSISAHNAFRRCQRQFLFAHIAAHWNAKSPIWRREAYVLKQLTDLDRWRGRIVHDVIASNLIQWVQGKMSMEQLSQKAIDLAKEQLLFSRKNHSA